MATYILPGPAFSARDRTSLAQHCRTYGEFVRVGFVNTLAYRLRYYTGIVTYFIYVSVYYFIWKAIFTHSARIEGFDFSQILTYIAVGWVIRSFYFNNIDQDMAQQVMEGKLAMDLIKPVNTQAMYVAQALGEALFRLVLLTAPAAVVLMLVYPLRRPASFEHFAAFFASVVFSFFIVAGINFAVGTLAIRLKSILGLLRAKYFLLELFSGLLLPISFFPRAAQKLLAAMPFQYISYVPVLIYLGKINGSGIWTALGLQLFWVAALLLVGDMMWRWSSRKITIQGG
ncbi:MAG: daunorubicin ABC transporter permease [Acidobacteria bacterium]|nr:MAG: daunorubicin ABC transporter permease [Acidobacteriota bacterium]PYV04453.1 MAG: daunorubicin ABC transporter permease [Acidobacteriota bacterium]